MRFYNPVTPQDFNDYFDLRWRVLRDPWGHAVGSEKDEHEAEAWHLMAKEDDLVLAVGRLQRLDEEAIQIRYMAVHPEFGGQGIGSRILKELENIARKMEAKEIRLDARETAVSFYEKNGYQVRHPGHLLWGEIAHFVMAKVL